MCNGLHSESWSSREDFFSRLSVLLEVNILKASSKTGSILSHLSALHLLQLLLPPHNLSWRTALYLILFYDFHGFHLILTLVTCGPWLSVEGQFIFCAHFVYLLTRYSMHIVSPCFSGLVYKLTTHLSQCWYWRPSSVYILLANYTLLSCVHIELAQYTTCVVTASSRATLNYLTSNYNLRRVLRKQGCLFTVDTGEQNTDRWN